MFIRLDLEGIYKEKFYTRLFASAKQAAPKLPSKNFRYNAVTKKILLIDDEPEILELLQDIFQEAGWIVQAHCSGASALKQVEKFSPDVIVSDATMPELNGLQVLARVREMGIQAPFLILTGYGDKLKAPQPTASVFCYLDKPFEYEILIGKAEEARITGNKAA